MDRKVALGDDFYFNNNDDKTHDRQPDMKGRLILNGEQLRALIQIHEEAVQDGEAPLLQIDLAGWKGKSKKDGKPYLFVKNEVYFGPRKAKRPVQKPNKPTTVEPRSDDDWL